MCLLSCRRWRCCCLMCWVLTRTRRRAFLPVSVPLPQLIIPSLLKSFADGPREFSTATAPFLRKCTCCALRRQEQELVGAAPAPPGSAGVQQQQIVWM